MDELLAVFFGLGLKSEEYALWNSIEDADESGRRLCEQSEKLSAKRFEAWKFRQDCDFFLSQRLLVQDAGLDVDLLLLLEEFTNDLSDAGWVLTTDDDRV